MGHVARKPDFAALNNKNADQHAHQHSLISVFVIRFHDSIIHVHVTKPATGNISVFYLVTESEQAGLSFACLQTR